MLSTSNSGHTLFNNAGLASSSGKPDTIDAMGEYAAALGLSQVDILWFSIGGRP
jgi:hypothetical protein